MFEGARTKVNRAIELTRLLEQDFSSFLGSEHFAVIQSADRISGEKRAVFKVLKPLPTDWPVKIGEIMHNLRSALDHAIHELTILGNGAALTNTEFPIFEDAEAYDRTKNNGEPERRSGLYKVRGIPAPAKTLVRNLQPFALRPAYSPGQEPVLALLHALNIVDKHREPVLSLLSTSRGGFGPIRDVSDLVTYITPTPETGTLLARWKPAQGHALDDESDLIIDMHFDVSFGKVVPLLAGQSVIPVCHACCRGTEKILSRLEGSIVGGLPTSPS